MSDLDYFYTRLIEQGQNGDRDDAISLLKEFVQFSRNGEEIPAPLVAYLGQCIAAWLHSECSPEQAAKAFNDQRPAYRDKSDDKSRHIKALRAYYLMRGRRKGRDEAISLAAGNVGLSESSIRKLLGPPVVSRTAVPTAPFEPEEGRDRVLPPSPPRLMRLPEKPTQRAPPSRPITVEQAAALLSINKRVRDRCLNPRRKRYQRRP
jgi:hypothetical protein